jgi:DNA-binding ferritin-like protein
MRFESQSFNSAAPPKVLCVLRPSSRRSRSIRSISKPNTATSKRCRRRWRLTARACVTRIDRADELGDKDTADLFTEVSRAVDKYLWFVEAHLG